MSYTHKSWQEIFAQEISRINATDVKILLDNVFDKIDPYHKEAPASSTGKYHPECSNGNGGLIRHTKYVTALALELIRATPEVENESDEIVAATILHDMLKYPNASSNDTGLKQYTVANHPTLMADLIRTLFPSSEKAKTIARLIECHQGRKEWNTDRTTGELINRPPEKQDEYLVHYADLLASRKWLCPEFDVDGNIVVS